MFVVDWLPRKIKKSSPDIGSESKRAQKSRVYSHNVLTMVVARWCMRMSGCVSGILDRISVYFGQPANSMAGRRTTATSPDVFGPDIRNLTHCASSTTAIRRSLGSGNLLEPRPKQRSQETRYYSDMGLSIGKNIQTVLN